MPLDFDFGNTPEGAAFFERHPKFYVPFERIIKLTNKAFGPRQAASSLEGVSIALGFTCCTDFLEIVFLAVNGHAIGATKILRGLYERSATLAFLFKNPGKVDRFIAYGAIIEHKLVKEARKHSTDQDINVRLGSDSIAAIEQRYEQNKIHFLRGTKVASSWDVDFASQVRSVGEPFTTYYLSAYLFPTQHTHAAITSILAPKDLAVKQHQCDFAVMISEALLLKVVEIHNTQFPIVTKEEMDSCNTEFRDGWAEFLKPAQNAKNAP